MTTSLQQEEIEHEEEVEQHNHIQATILDESTIIEQEELEEEEEIEHEEEEEEEVEGEVEGEGEEIIDETVYTLEFEEASDNEDKEYLGELLDRRGSKLHRFLPKL